MKLNKNFYKMINDFKGISLFEKVKSSTILSGYFKTLQKAAEPQKVWFDRELHKYLNYSQTTSTLPLAHTLFFNDFAMSKKFFIPAVLAATAIFFVGASGLTIVAAQAEEVGPGNPLYPIDLALENAQVALASDDQKAEL